MPVAAAPTLTATAQTTGIATVNLTWTNIATNTGYTVSMAPAGPSGSLINLSSNVVSYLTPSLSAGVTYSFQIATLNASGLGANSTPAKTAIPYVAPSAVASFSISAANTSNVLNWTAPSNNGGNAVTGYKWFRSQMADMSVIDASLAVGAVLTSTNAALTNGSAYYYYIRASNAAGLGVSSQIVSATPRTVPATIVVSNAFGNQQITLSWAVPLSNGAPITGYNLNYSTTATTGPWTSLSSGMLVSPYVATGLTNGSSYFFQLAASNAAGYGTYSTAVAIVPKTTPSAPASLTVTPGNTSNVLVWTAPASNGGSVVTGYKWIRSQLSDMSVIDASYGPSNVLTNTNTALTNGTTYYYQVQASNAAGFGALMSIVSSMPRTTPGTTSISVTGTSPTSFNLSFSATNGGSSNAYVITPYSNAVAQSTITVSDSPVTYNGSFGVAYTFAVRASNVAGFGTASAVTAPATPNYIAGGALANPAGSNYWFFPPTSVAAGVVAYNLAYADVSISQLSNAVWTISYGGASDTLTYVRNISLADRKVWIMDASYSTTGGSYLTIATNNASLSNGDVLRVGSGVYLAATQPTVNKSITLEGPPDGSAVFGVAPGVSTWCLTIDTDNVVVRNLTLDTCYALSTAVRGDFSLLVGSTATTVSGVPLVVRELSNILVENMQFKNSYTKSGVASSFNRWDNRRGVAINSVSGLILRNCTFPKTWEFGLTLASCRNAVVTGNTFYACGGGSVNVTTTNQKMRRFILSNDLTEYETYNVDLTGNTFLDFGDLSLTTIVPTPSGGWSSLKTLQNPTITIQPSLGYTITHSSNAGSNVRMPPEYGVSYTLMQNAYFGQDATDLPPTFWPDATAVTVMSNNARIFPPGYATAAQLLPNLVSVGEYVQGSVAVTVSSAMEYVTYAFSLDGSLAGSNTSGAFAFTGLSEGSHTVAVTGTDGYVTSAAANLAFVSDSILPTISGLTLVTGPNLSGEIVVTFDASDANGPLSYTTFLNDVSFADGSPAPDTIQLPDYGAFEVKVSVRDPAGNVGTSSSLTVEYWPEPADLSEVTLEDDQTEQSLNINGEIVVAPVVDIADFETAVEDLSSGDIVVIREDDGSATAAIYTPDVPTDIESAVSDAIDAGIDTILVEMEDSQGNLTIHEATYTEEETFESSNSGVTVYADTSAVDGWLSTPPAVDPETGDVQLYYRAFDADGSVIPEGFSVPIWITKSNVDGPSIAIWHRPDALQPYEYLGAAMRVSEQGSIDIVETGSDVFYYELTVNDEIQARDPTEPNPPTGASASQITSTSVRITWSAPINDGGAAIESYDIMNGAIALQSTSSLTATVSGLSPSTAYTFTVRASNAIGNSVASNTVRFSTRAEGGAAVGDPYISTLDGKLYKLPSFNGHIRLYQGYAAGQLLTVNATTRIDDDKASMDADTEIMNRRLAAPVSHDLQMKESMSFFERIYISYAGETMIVNVYDGFKIEKNAAGWPVEVVGNVQTYLKAAFSFYDHLAGDIVEISPCPDVAVRIGIVPIRSIRNSVEIVAPNMAAGNGVFVHRMNRKAMSLRKLSDIRPVEKKDAAVKRTICETFVCDAKTSTVNIPYVG